MPYLKNMIWLVKDGRLHRQKIEIGAKGTEQTQVLSGITANDLIALKPEIDWQEDQSVHSILIKPSP
ncbi:MAG: hypothetical protein R3E60_05510 [Alphaproteobacteria bacterium]